MAPPAVDPRQFIHALHRSHRDGLFVFRPYIKAFGLLKAVFLQELIYLDEHFSKRTGNEGWFYRQRATLTEYTGLSEDQQKRLTRELKEDGVIKVIKQGLPARNWYSINYDRLQELFLTDDREKGAPTSPGESPALDRVEAPHIRDKSKTTDYPPLGGAAQKRTAGRGPVKTPPAKGFLEDAVVSAGGKEEPVKRPRDPRTDHPAIQAVRSVAAAYPPKGRPGADPWDDVIRALGDAPDLDLLRRCRRVWLEKGFSPANLAWALDWYPAGGPPSSNGRTPQGGRGPAVNATPLANPKTIAALQSLLTVWPGDVPALDAQVTALRAHLDAHDVRGTVRDLFAAWLDSRAPYNGAWLRKDGTLRPGHLDPAGQTVHGFTRWARWYEGHDD